MTRTVRLTIWPARVLEISDAEFLDLDRRNMILHAEPLPAPPPTPDQVEGSPAEPEPAADVPAEVPAPRPRRRLADPD